jgi:hypothetical protein
MADGAEPNPKLVGAREPHHWSTERRAERRTRSARATLDQGGELAGHEGLHHATSTVNLSAALRARVAQGVLATCCEPIVPAGTAAYRPDREASPPYAAVHHHDKYF